MRPVTQLLVLVAVLALGCSAAAQARTVTVTHGVVPAPAYLDGGDPGPSAGDVRVFQFAGASDGVDVQLDVLMTTTSSGTPDAGLERRITKLVFTFADPADQIIVEGVARYPLEGATIELGNSVVRPVIGGSGIYPGASGQAVSTQAADGTWTHVLHLES